MIARLAQQGDDALLAAFNCSTGPQYELSVELWIREDAWEWFATAQPGSDRRLILLETDDGELAAVGAHERGEHDWERFVSVCQVRHHPICRY